MPHNLKNYGSKYPEFELLMSIDSSTSTPDSDTLIQQLSFMRHLLYINYSKQEPFKQSTM